MIVSWFLRKNNVNFLLIYETNSFFIFNTEVSPKIAFQLGLPACVVGLATHQRFAFFADDNHLAVVAGAQEGDDVELALACTRSGTPRVGG